jgi:hypothetical protein
MYLLLVVEEFIIAEAWSSDYSTSCRPAEASDCVANCCEKKEQEQREYNMTYEEQHS